MAIVKVIDNEYKTKRALYKVLDYVLYNSEEVGGCGIGITSLDGIFREFELIKRVWGKDAEGFRQVKHFVVSFKRNEVTYKTLEQIAFAIAEYYGKKYQVLYGIHTDTNNLHIHYAVNSVSFIDGKMLSEGYWELQFHIKEVNEIISDFKSHKFRRVRTYG